ncbi:MAG: hypothetical protein C0467_15735 [Planctomycetaceae bacterium]|nr:hypothetical protein [Planctomycetaceae bacterium]
MNRNARLGKWVLIVLIVFAALSELAVVGFSIWAHRFEASHISRVLLTGWLLWRIWDGAEWARWLVAVLGFAGVLLVVIFGLVSPAVEGRPELVAFLVGCGVVYAAFGIGLASPWVGAYQAARRGDLDIEQFLLPERRGLLPPSTPPTQTPADAG